MAITDTRESGTFTQFDLAQGMRLFVAPTAKFKRTKVNVFVHDQLDVDRVSLGGLLPYIQKRGTQNHPSGLALERAAGELYDASLSGAVHKIGDRQVLAYELDLPADRYVSEPVFERGLKLLAEMVDQPLQQDGGLHPEYVEQEKRFQIGRVKALVNDKIRYALFRCTQEMFRGEPFAQYELGSEEGIAQATPESLLVHHQELLATRPIDVYVVGDVEPEKVKDAVLKALVKDRGEVVEIPRTNVSMGQGEARRVTQEEAMNQGWLVVGLRTDIRRCDPERYGMLFFNGILGGFAHSKLFVNVREKASLAYSAFSFYDSNKGSLSAMAGIDVNKVDQALEITQQQIQDTIQGRFSDEDLEATRRAFLTQFRMRLDSTSGRILQHLGGSAEGCPESVEEVLQKVQAVTRDDIQKAAQRIRTDMIYFLKGTN